MCVSLYFFLLLCQKHNRNNRCDREWIIRASMSLWMPNANEDFCKIRKRWMKRWSGGLIAGNSIPLVCSCLLAIGLRSAVDTFLICLDNKSRLYTITKYFPSIFRMYLLRTDLCCRCLLAFGRITDIQRWSSNKNSLYVPCKGLLCAQQTHTLRWARANERRKFLSKIIPKSK